MYSVHSDLHGTLPVLAQYAKSKTKIMSANVSCMLDRARPCILLGSTRRGSRKAAIQREGMLPLHCMLVAALACVSFLEPYLSVLWLMWFVFCCSTFIVGVGSCF